MQENIESNKETHTMPKVLMPASECTKFQALIQEAIDQSKATQALSGLMLIEISNLAVIMHINGKPFIDNMMQAITELLWKTFSEETTISRTQINHLTIIINGCSIEKMEDYAEKIYKDIRAISCTLEGAPIYIAPFLGSVCFSDDIQNAEDALDKLYIALKNTEQECNHYYSTYQNAQENLQFMKNRMVLANCMEDSLVRNRLRLAFQPIIHSKTGIISHHECLLRIISPEGKFVSVGPFIPVVEEMGFINEIDELVLELVCQELKESPNIHLGFNISAIGINNSKWMQRAKVLFKDPDIASRAIVEITETAAQNDIYQASQFIRTLQDMGCQVALDDFGAGHTSFRQLKELPVDIVKIDGSFIRDLADNHNNWLFVKSLLDISKSFGLKTVAEFVETGEVAKLLMELKVDYFQGNYFFPTVNYRSWRQEEIL